MSVRDTSIDSRLLQSARDEFMKHGFIRADLKTICDNAGVTTGAVYKRYKGKEELFSAVVRETVETLDSFIALRTDVEFDAMTDDEVRKTWIMDEEHVFDMFRMLWEIREDFVLLLEKSSGTSYENYDHEFSLRMTKAYMQYYEEVKRRGFCDFEITETEMHVMCTSFWTSVYEPFVHDMSWEDVKEHCRVLCRFFNWADAIGLK